jgi:hypothetical protein
VIAAVLSPDGNCVLYQTATNLAVADVASGSNLFSVKSVAPIRNAAEWSADGRYFAFVSSMNLVSQNDDGTNKVYLYDLLTGTITLIGVSGPSTGSLAALSDSPAMSGNGRFVVFRSAVTNSVPGDTNPPPNLFLFDRLTGSTAVLTAGQAGASPVSWTSRPAISDSGNTVAFLDLGSGLAPADLNRAPDAFATPIVNSGTPADSDGDGIPDWWMMQYFGHSTGQEYDLSRAQDDADGDGVSNRQEFLGGTVPTDPASVFVVQLSAEALTNGAAALSWPAVAGKSYQVQYKANLSDPVWLNAPGHALVADSLGSFTTPATQLNCYYRVLAVD